MYLVYINFEKIKLLVPTISSIFNSLNSFIFFDLVLIVPKTNQSNLCLYNGFTLSFALYLIEKWRCEKDW